MHNIRYHALAHVGRCQVEDRLLAEVQRLRRPVLRLFFLIVIASDRRVVTLSMKQVIAVLCRY